MKKFSRDNVVFQKAENIRQKLLIQQLLNEDLKHIEYSDLDREIHRRLGYEYPHKDALLLKSKFTVSELSRFMNNKGMNIETAVLSRKASTLDIPKFTKDRGKFSAAEVGTILHKVMEHIDFLQIKTIWDQCENKMESKNGVSDVIKEKTESIKKIIYDLGSREILTSEEISVISIPKIINFFDSEIGRRACRSDKLFKEVEFNFMTEISGENVIIQGAIDCYFMENGNYILLDYKSDYLFDTEDESEINKLADNYKLQLELYKTALEKIRGIKVKEVYLYLFSLGRGIRIA